MQTMNAATRPRAREIKVSVRLLDGDNEQEFRLPETATLLEVLEQGATRLSVQLLPNPQQPLDRLYNVRRPDGVGPAIEDLDQELGDYVGERETTRDFAIELVLAFRVNTRWTIAPSASLTPRQILDLDGIKLDPAEYTLYLPGSTDLLPIDTPITITRGFVLEAQRDGKYGGAA